MKKQKVISILLAVFILLTSTVFAKDYSDYSQRFWDLPKTHWAYEYISELADKGVINGNEDGSFRPDDTVSRAEWSKMLVVASGKKINKTSTAYAVDYNSNDWYFDYINSVIEYMNFYSNGNDYYFLPNQSASREDVTVSLVRLKGYNTNNVDYSYITKFKDFNSISNDLKKYVAVAIEKGLIEGFEDNTFRGQDTLTRAEAATLLCRAFQLGNDNKVSSNNSVFIESSNNNSDDKKINNNESNNISNKSETEYNLNDKKDDKETNKKEEKDEDEEEIIEEEKKPYKIETLVKADVKSFRRYSFYDDTLYYLDDNDNTFYKYNLNKNKKEKIMTVDDVEVTYEGTNYKVKKISSIYYDSFNDTLVIYGDFENNNPFNETKTIYARTVTIPDCEYIETHKSTDLYPHLIGTDNEGRVIDWYGIKVFDEKNNEFNTIIDANALNYTRSLALSFHQTKNGIYFINKGVLSFYNYDDLNIIISFNDNDVASSGVNDKYAIFMGGNVYGCYNLKNEDDSIIFDNNDIDITDSKSLKNDSFEEVSYLSSNNDIVVYDNTNKCFRIISENK